VEENIFPSDSLELEVSEYVESPKVVEEAANPVVIGLKLMYTLWY
jgi:hypothetical protein